MARVNALVLAGGAARGAYEVGVVDYILGEVAQAVGRTPEIDILCGTSVGAINACVVAGHKREPRECRRILIDEWENLQLDEIVRGNTGEVVRLFGGLVHRTGARFGMSTRGGFLDPRGIEGIVARAVPFARIEENLETGHLLGLTISTTHLVSGKTVIFASHAKAAAPRWSRDPTIAVVKSVIDARHVLASSALPLLFPAVFIDGECFCDGGLRQNVPLSPARRLGATGLIVVNPRFIGSADIPASGNGRAPSPLFVLGKALNALLLDRIDNDLARLRRINAILEAGVRSYGPSFLDVVNVELGHEASAGVRPLEVVHIRASEDIGRLAAAYVGSPEFAARAPGVVGRLLRRIGEWDARGEADLLSYLLFDGGFASQLIALGRRDARGHHDELCAFFSRE